MDELKARLAAEGFQFSANPISRRENDCKWYAWRRSTIPARECECNNKPHAQIVVYPFSAVLVGKHRHESVEVEVCGEADGVWWKLSAYSLKPEDLPKKLPAVEAALVRAWNAIVPTGGTD